MRHLFIDCQPIVPFEFASCYHAAEDELWDIPAKLTLRWEKKKDFGCEGGGKSLLDVFDFVFKYLNCRSYASPCSLLRWILFCSLTFF